MKTLEQLNGVAHIFFDLDNTLWDFDANSKEALSELYNDFLLNEKGVATVDAWLARYRIRNDEMWKAYREGRVDQSRLRWERFNSTLVDFGAESSRKLALDMSDRYLQLVSQKSILLPGAMEVLETLKQDFALHIITNGFEEVQQEKLKRSAMDHYFGEIVTSERAGAVKPSRVIFDFALNAAGARPEQSIYIGDKADVDGSSERVGIRFIHFNPHGRQSSAPRQVAELTELVPLIQKS